MFDLSNTVSEGASGAMVAYSRFNGQPRLVLAQRIDSSGNTRWIDTVDQTAGAPQDNLRLFGLQSGNAPATFTIHAGNPYSLLGTASCIDTAGTFLWRQIPFSSQAELLAAAGDNAGGVYVLASVQALFKYDYRFSVQHIDGAGNLTWLKGATDIDTTSAQFDSLMPRNPVLKSDGGGVIAAWEQNRTGTLDIFAQHIDVNGALPIQLSSFEAIAGSGSDVKLSWKTLTEVNCYGYEVQKAGNASKVFQSIPGSFTPGGGTTSSPRSYDFTDLSALPGSWQYRLKQTDREATVYYSEAVAVTVGSGPTAFVLRQNYPNPFNPSTTFSYDLAGTAHVSFSVFNALGHRVATIVNGEQPVGIYRLTFDARLLRFARNDKLRTYSTPTRMYGPLGITTTVASGPYFARPWARAS